MKKQLSTGLQLGVLIMSILFCLIIAGILASITLNLMGFDIENMDLANPKIYLIQGFFSQLIGFLGGFILFLRLTKQSFKSLINWSFPTMKMSLIIVGILVLSYPIMLILSYYNSFLSELIPNNYFILEEERTIEYQKNILMTSGIIFLVIKIVVLAILPAIAEELIFRGVLLKMINKASNNVHYAVIVSGIIFAGIHFQPTKLLPMIFLGVVLGYIYTKTKNISYSILFHFIFNLSSILLAIYWPEM